MRVHDYVVLTAETPEHLKDQVREHIHLGWTLQGGVSVSLTAVNDPDLRIMNELYAIEREYAQAMIWEWSNPPVHPAIGK